jgi:hypothetical protein
VPGECQTSSEVSPPRFSSAAGRSHSTTTFRAVVGASRSRLCGIPERTDLIGSCCTLTYRLLVIVIRNLCCERITTLGRFVVACTAMSLGRSSRWAKALALCGLAGRCSLGDLRGCGWISRCEWHHRTPSETRKHTSTSSKDEQKGVKITQGCPLRACYI